MNILYIAHEMNLGGATRSLIALIDEMLKKGHKIFVLVPKQKGDLVDELKEKDVKLIYSKYYWWMSKPKTLKIRLKIAVKQLLNSIAIFQIIRELKPYEIDVIHTNSLVINIGGHLRKRTKIPHVWHIREFGEEDHGIFFNYDIFKALKFIEKNSDAVIVISEALKNKYKDFLNKSKLNLIYNGISADYEYSKKHGNYEVFNLLISGSLNEGKGQDQAILAVNTLVSNGQKNIVLYIAGRGNNEYTKKLKKLVEENKLIENVKFLGYVENIREIRHKTDIELVCSRSEAFGRVTVEAMMSMNPVIATNSGANPELIQDGFNGLLYKQGDYHDLADKLEYLINNSDLIEKFGINGHKFALDNYTAESNASKIENLYLKLVEKLNS